MVCHGIPSDGKKLKNGDIINIDVTVIKDGYHGDTSIMVPVGNVPTHAQRLIQITQECLYKALDLVKPGATLGDIGHVIQQHAEKNGFSVVRDLVGHGLGTKLHEEPQVPNYGRQGHGKRIQNGLTIAIEPMINMGTFQVKTLDDQWTIVTEDGLPSAHFEHDVAVIDGKAEILSTFDYIYEALKL